MFQQVFVAVSSDSNQVFLLARQAVRLQKRGAAVAWTVSLASFLLPGEGETEDLHH